ncbi:MAG: HAD family phosphatase [Coriobacteriia bacterium]|nr:HAD family phosphatase [Coriobacteriia bacterium]
MTRKFSEAQGVILDCDGTLLDSIGMWNAMERDLCERAGIPYSKEVADLLTTYTLPESAQWFFDQGFRGSAEEVAQEIDDYIMDYYAHRAQARPGALDFVRSLHERGVRMVCASSTPHAQLEVGLKATGFFPYLLAIMSTDDAGCSKRDPSIYHQCREILGTPLERTWGVEDAIYAIRTLNSAGYGTIGIYDRDESGTWEDLSAEATIALRSWADPADLAKLA